MASKGLENILLRANKVVMRHDWNLEIERDPSAHKSMNPFVLTVNQELRRLNSIHLKNRAQKMRKLYIEDFLREEKELREVGLAYIDTQP